MEILGFVGIGLGALLAFIGWVWLVVLGFKVGGPLWGILNFLFSPLAAIVFCVMKKTGWVPLALMLVGIFFYAVGAIPVVISMMDSAGSAPQF